MTDYENAIEAVVDLLWREFDRYLPDGAIHPHAMRGIAAKILDALRAAGLVCGPDHLHYSIEFEASAPLCPYCGCPADAPVTCARPFHAGYEIHGVDEEGEPLTGRTAWFPIDAFADYDPNDPETCSALVHYPEGVQRVLVPTAQYVWVLAYGPTDEDLMPMCEACMDRIAKQYGTTAAHGALRRK